MSYTERDFVKTDLQKCPHCEAPVKYTESTKTLVGYGGYKAPHDHDDNCVLHRWVCDNGHQIQERRQNLCPVEGCDWKGHTECFCSHFGISVYDPASKTVVYKSV